MTVLITGGHGFIGSHLADALVDDGERVRILDAFDDQVHPAAGGGPAPGRRTEVIRGDVRDPDIVKRSLEGVDTVYHFAAAVGVGQSMYEVRRYMDINSVGTAVLMEALVDRPVERLVVASSMSVYGEGLYRDATGRLVHDAERSPAALRAGQWEPTDPLGRPLEPIPTTEEKRPSLASVYALSKYDQERLCLMLGAAYNIPTVALRFFNVYGPRQTLGNPYTGVLAIFATRVMNGNPPLVFEDGAQRRDFVSVHDVVRACLAARQRDEAVGETINIGSGEPHTVLAIAHRVIDALGSSVAPEITGRYRSGDVRHCYADIQKARRLLGHTPKVPLAKGIREWADWLQDQQAEDPSEAAGKELETRGLLV